MRKTTIFIALAAIAALLTCCTHTEKPVSGVVHETEVFSIKEKDTLKIDFYEDRSVDIPEGGRPVMIYIHGGGFTTGERVNAAQQVFCNYLAERGWLGVSVDYRLAGITWSEEGIVNPYGVDGTVSAIRYATEDIVAATKYILETKKGTVNPAKICLAGGSAGACTALQLVYDCCNEEPYTESLPEGFSYAGVISQAGCISANAESIEWKNKPCPIMFFHGDQDTVVPLEKGNADCTFFGTLYIERQLKEMGVPYWKWIEKGADHVMAMKPLTTYLEEQYRFLNDFVINGLDSVVLTEVADKEPAGMSSVEAMIKYVPLYILGYGKYLEEIDWGDLSAPTQVVY